MSIFLCGNTGALNRGCEAIIRSTVKVINQRHSDVYLATFAPKQDRVVSAGLGINMIPYNSYPSNWISFFCKGIHKVYPRSTLHQNYIQRTLWSKINRDDICLNIGGDTYCYGRPEVSLALNKYVHRQGTKSILWCCSIEEDRMKGEILRDLKRYTYILAREQITYGNLLKAGVPESKVKCCCDPAFFLDTKQIRLPEAFIHGNTIGINVSEIIVKSDNDKVYLAILGFIRYILESTDMNVCLIPHVYSVSENKCDFPILKKIYDDLNSPRISIIDEELTCEELKYVISKCRFMIAARTHASIAAYSTCVPTLVLGYSVKSKGIAKDLFGRSEDYVIPFTEIEDSNQIINAFQFLLENEQGIKQTLSRVLPAYKEMLLTAIRETIPDQKELTLCDRIVCTGCGVCSAACPQHCIHMEPERNGFLYPVVDKEKCTQCGQCRKTCPVLNRISDNSREPLAYALRHKSEEIRKSSSSGGAFYAFANSILARGGIVYGAAFDKEFRVKHIRCDSSEHLFELQGSKYVQSSLKDVYSSVLSAIAEGKPVLFSGTPCQIAALKAYLKTDPEQLFTVECICHGVPSPRLWELYKSYREKEAGAKISKVTFRDKTESWKVYSLAMAFENGKEYKGSVLKDPYLRFFVQGYSLRDSCSLCAFRNMHRLADISMADFWGISNITSDIKDDRGTSLILVQSEKGKQLLESITSQTELIEVDFRNSIRQNQAYLQNRPEALLHKVFMSASENKEFGELVNQFDMQKIAGKVNYYLEEIRLLFQ